MEITIRSTSKIVDINGVPARVWEGKSAKGIDVICFVTRVLVKAEEDMTEFEQDLQDVTPPSPDALAIPSEFIL